MPRTHGDHTIHATATVTVQPGNSSDSRRKPVIWAHGANVNTRWVPHRVASQPVEVQRHQHAQRAVVEREATTGGSDDGVIARAFRRHVDPQVGVGRVADGGGRSVPDARRLGHGLDDRGQAVGGAGRRFDPAVLGWDARRLVDADDDVQARIAATGLGRRDLGGEVRLAVADANAAVAAGSDAGTPATLNAAESEEASRPCCATLEFFGVHKLKPVASARIVRESFCDTHRSAQCKTADAAHSGDANAHFCRLSANGASDADPCFHYYRIVRYFCDGFMKGAVKAFEGPRFRPCLDSLVNPPCEFPAPGSPQPFRSAKPGPSHAALQPRFGPGRRLRCAKHRRHLPWNPRRRERRSGSKADLSFAEKAAAGSHGPLLPANPPRSQP
jgi:hypothetical protein